MGSENRSGKVPLISKIAYGFGDVGCNFSWMFVSNFLMIFYTDVFGISMAAVSALMLFSRFWDAINDPIVGGLTDKTKTRWGRYRPWLLVAAPITAVLLVMTFWARPDWNQTAKIVYMVITYCLLVLGYTCVNIPYGTLCGAMTQDIDERAKINTSRSVAAMIAIGVLNIITVPLINKFGSSSANTGKRKNFYKSPAKSGASESSVSAGSGRTDFIWFYFIWKKCGCPVLFYLCRRKCLVLYHLFDVHHYSFHYWSSLLSAGIP